MPDPSLEAAYRDTDYWVDDAPNGPFAFRIGRPCVELAELLCEDVKFDWAYVTACNPGSVRLSDEENARRMAELEADVRKPHWRVFHGRGVGRDGAWPPEPSLLIVGIPEAEAVALGRRFGQNAVVVGWADGRGRLVWLS